MYKNYFLNKKPSTQAYKLVYELYDYAYESMWTWPVGAP